MNKLIQSVYFAYSDDEDDIVGQDVNVQQHTVINDDILEEEESESITSVKMATWLIVIQISFKKCHMRKNSLKSLELLASLCCTVQQAYDKKILYIHQKSF